jgi:hypothetical protein
MVIHKLFLLNIYRKSVTVYNTCFHHYKFKTVRESIHCFKIHFVTEKIENFLKKFVGTHILVAGKNNYLKLQIIIFNDLVNWRDVLLHLYVHIRIRECRIFPFEARYLSKIY